MNMNITSMSRLQIVALVLIGVISITMGLSATWGYGTSIASPSDTNIGVADESAGIILDRRPSIDPDLMAVLKGLNPNDTADVIVTFVDNDVKAGYSRLFSLLGGSVYVFSELPMIRALLPKWFIDILSQDPHVISIYLNKQLQYFLRESVEAINAPYVWNGVFAPRTCGYNATVAIIDSGIDQTHPDLQNAVILNIKIADGLFINMTGLNTDTTSGHGTHVAGIVAGKGNASDGYYVGVAPCARLIGLGAGEALFILYPLQAYDWILQNYVKYNIRVISNSWGTGPRFDPYDPINIASFEAYKRGIISVFAFGNSGPGIATYNAFAVMPWVIGVAAGTKEGELAWFSSRGIPGHIFIKPTITAPGVDIVSARSSTIGITATDTNINPVDPNWTARYTMLSGTSMATPHVSGVIALMLSVNPKLSPDQIIDIIRNTARPMPGYKEFEVGAGYLDASTAVALAAGVKGDLDTWKPRWNPDKVYEWVFGRTIYTGDLLPSQRYFSGTTPPGERLVGLLGAKNPTHVVSIDRFYDIVPIKVVAELTWTVAACDLDLAVYDPKGNLIAYGGAAIGPEHVEFTAYPNLGNYTFEVVVWLCPAPTPYTLNVTILYGSEKLVKVIKPKPVVQPVDFDYYVTTPRIFKVYNGVGIAAPYYVWGDRAFIRFTVLNVSGSPVDGLSLTVTIVHDTGLIVYTTMARGIGGGTYQVDLSFDQAWPSGRYKILVNGSYKLTTDRSDFYVNWLGVFLKPHERVVGSGGIVTLYLRSATLNSVTLSDIPIRPVIAVYKIYINGTLADFTVGTILNDWVVIQVKMPSASGFYVVRIEGTYSEPLVNRFWRGFFDSWVFIP